MDRRAEITLAERLLARDETALREVISDYGGIVLGMARRVLADPTLAEEVAQDTFVAMWRRPGAFDPTRGSLRGFLAGVARNKAIDLVRREEARRRARDSLVAETEVASRIDISDESFDERQAIDAALGQLTDVQREAIQLAYFGGRTYREVAEELGVPEGTAKTRLRDGLIRLRQVMGSRESGS